MPPTENQSGDQFSDTVYASTSPSDGTSVEENFPLNINSRDWLSFLLMTLGEPSSLKPDRTVIDWLSRSGWFILLSSLIGFWRVKHWESSIRSSNARGPVTPEEVERDITTCRSVEQVFGLPPEGEPSPSGALYIPTQRELEEARLEQDLRAAGLL